MKIALLAVLLLATGCTNLPDGITELSHRQVRSIEIIHYGAANFQAQDTASWRRIHETIKLAEAARSQNGLLVLCFIDTNASRITPSLPATQGRMIAQSVVWPDGKRSFEADPFDTGRYHEPK